MTVRARRVVLGLPGSEAAAQGLAGLVGGDVAKVETRKFPDEETYVRVDGDVADGDCIVVAQMVRPDQQLMPLVFLADALRDLGAARVGLVLPYLPYMRQDTRFLPGEAITSRSFARLLSSSADWLVTVDPHLHRYASLDELYTLRSHVVSSSDAIAEWVQREVPAPLIIGPDEESAQWVSRVARRIESPWRTLRKRRLGDRRVEIDADALDDAECSGRTPVLLDDILSSGRTMQVAIERLAAMGMPRAICIAVHAVQAEATTRMLLDAGASAVITCNTRPAALPQIDLWPDIGRAIGGVLAAVGAHSGPDRPRAGRGDAS
jgi:ribose-phosphate pyrophosphokinase